MAQKEFIFNVTTLAGCKYSILKDLEENFQVEKAYRRKYNLSKLASLAITGLAYFDDLRYRSISKDFEIQKDPIYVLGHWRSGTTFLHQLLCSYNDVSYPTTYQTVFPNNLFFLQGLLKAIVKFYMPEKRLVDEIQMHVDFPQEEDFALGNEVGFSFYYWFYFPGDYKRIREEHLTLSKVDETKRKAYMEGYRRFIKRSLLYVKGGQYIAKNPPNMARIPFLLEMFPESRFVYIERNPYEVILSTFKFFKGFLITLQLQEISDDDLWEFIFSNYRMMYEIYQVDKLQIPSGNLVELRYEELIRDPASVMELLQKDLLSDLIPNELKLRSMLETHQKHAPNKYDFEKGYVERVNSELGGLIEKQGYKLL